MQRRKVPIQMTLVRYEHADNLTFYQCYTNVPFFPAIIRLDKPIPLYYDEKDNDVQSAVVPVCLPLEDNDVGRNLADGDRLTVTGWRRTRNSQFQTNFTLFQQNEPTGILQKRVIPILSKVECLKIGHYRENLQLNFDLQFCAGDKEGKYYH